MGGSESSANRLAVSGLTAGYGASVAVRNVNITVAPGEAVALLGRNGAGHRDVDEIGRAHV